MGSCHHQHRAGPLDACAARVSDSESSDEVDQEVTRSRNVRLGYPVSIASGLAAGFACYMTQERLT